MSDEAPRSLTADADLASALLDHAAELVALVSRAAPPRYETLLASPVARGMLAGDNAFNAGKLYVYAEFLVFREELLRRFPEATSRACLNAFCRLFMKNDISLSNLVRVFEEGGEDDLARLARLDRDP